jgi:hypothetical protein
MPVNHLEQIVAEWLEYQGYFVRRNAKVGKRKKGGYECELDIVAFHPGKKRLVHYEPSTDTNSWAKRESRYRKKFEAGRKHIATLFDGVIIPDQIEQFAVFLYGSDSVHKEVGGGKIIMMDDLVKQITDDLRTKPIAKAIVPEQFALLRVLHLACEFRSSLFTDQEKA